MKQAEKPRLKGPRDLEAVATEIVDTLFRRGTDYEALSLLLAREGRPTGPGWSYNGLRSTLLQFLRKEFSESS